MQKTCTLVLLGLLLSACGKHSDLIKTANNLSEDQKSFDAVEEPFFHATYLAVLHVLNEPVAGAVSGAVTMSHQLSNVIGDVRVTNAAPNIIHAQNIHIGERCPTLADDENKDGFIDYQEAKKVTGPILIPLDGNLNSQLGSYGVFPVADAWGSYVYSEIANFEAFLGDLKDQDENSFDDIMKLPTSSLSLKGKVVLIHGVSKESVMPYSVATSPDLTADQTLPIACGILMKVDTVPGVYERDDRTVGRISSPRTAHEETARSTTSGRRQLERGDHSATDRNDGPNIPEDEATDENDTSTSNSDGKG